MFRDYGDSNTICSSAPCGVWIDDFEITEITDQTIPYFNDFEDEMLKWNSETINNNICTPTTIGTSTNTSPFIRATVASGYYNSADTVLKAPEYSANDYSNLTSPNFLLNGTDIKINFTLRVRMEANYDGVTMYYRYNKTGSWTEINNASTTGVYFTTNPYATYAGYGGHGGGTTSCMTNGFSNQDTGLLTIDLSSAQNTGSVEIMFNNWGDASCVCNSPANCGVYIDDFQVSEVASDACSCPGLNTDWAINMADYCNTTVACNLGTGNVSVYGSGRWYVNAQVTTQNLNNFSYSGMYVKMNSSSGYLKVTG